MKDAKGHGSDPRGGSNPADAHQKRIAIDTVRNPLKGQFLGGPNAQEAEQILRSKFGYGDSQIDALKGNQDKAAAAELARGSSKSTPSPVHPSMTHEQKLASDLADFRTKYGPPRDLKAEARGFASGKREINRLRKQGK